MSMQDFWGVKEVHYGIVQGVICGKMAHEGQHQSPLELITQNVRSILAVVNKLECGNVDHSIDFARYRVEWLCSVLVKLGESLEENLLD